MTLTKTYNNDSSPATVLAEDLLEQVVQEPAVDPGKSNADQLAEAEQFAAIGKMAASLMHDFKGPLTVIRGCAELLVNPNISQEKREMYSRLIVEDVDRFLEMSQELLDYSRGGQNLRREPVQLGTWLEKLTEPMKEVMDASSVQLNTDFSFIGEVKFDESRVRRVVHNLVSNAVEAMPDGGQLTISSEVTDNMWRLSVADTGRGIPADVRSTVFEPFVTHGKKNGTGLGLATAQEIVQGHGGSLNFDTRTLDEPVGAASGTTFVMEIPMSPPLVSAQL
jgi:signal transduction histidine kinase